jgi:hypothetical protein
MTRVLTCLGMVSVLLLTSFVTNVNAAETSDLGVSRSGVGATGEFNEVKITLSGFPGQTGESVTNVGLTPRPCGVQNDIICTGFSHILIPGIGEGTSVFVIPSKRDDGRLLLLPFFLLVFTFVVYELTVQSFPFLPITRTIDIPDIGTGQVTIQLL